MTGSTTSTALARPLVAERRSRLVGALADAPFDAVLSLSVAGVDYATGYRSLSGAVHAVSGIGVVTTGDSTLMAAPVADSAPAFEAGIGEDDLAAYGRFYFESEGGAARATRLVDEHATQADAIATIVRRAGLAAATIGIERGAASAELVSALQSALPDVTWVDATLWLGRTRAVKLPGELALLERSALAAEAGMVAAIEAATVGTTEKELARIVARTMVDAGLEPRFTVVTSGPRSALADALPSDRAIQPGDLVRFDVGGTLDGYWSDLGRTAVVGEPTARQSSMYQAILDGVEAEYALAAPGVSGERIFARAIEVTQDAGGPNPYRRQHAGHGIGLTTYEPPIIRPGDEGLLEEGMTFCFETPYYELGWGGMMVEDLMVVTADGCRRLTAAARGLTVIPA